MSAILLCMLSVCCCDSSRIAPDETVVFFPAIGRPAKAGGGWEVEIRGRTFEREDDSSSRQAFIALIRSAVGASDDPAEKANLDRRLRPFIADNERGKAIEVRLCGKTCEMGKSEPSGQFHGTIELTGEEVRKELEKAGAVSGRLMLEAVLPAGDARSFRGEVYLLAHDGLSVISDVDDTIKVSEVLDRKAFLRNTLLRDFRPVISMPELYASWALKGATFHYVTASPWQLYEPLTEFMSSSGFPAGTFHMKQFRLKDSTVFDMFASPVQYKRSQIDPLIQSFPKRKFIFVGDSGEKDPEIYGEVARKFPDSVASILIRDVTEEDAGSDRMRKAFEGVPKAVWRVFRDPKELSELAETFPAKTR